MLGGAVVLVHRVLPCVSRHPHVLLHDVSAAIARLEGHARYPTASTAAAGAADELRGEQRHAACLAQTGQRQCELFILPGARHVGGIRTIHGGVLEGSARLL